MTQYVFDLCVDWLHRLATWFGTDYVTINVVLFCVLGPLAVLVLFLTAYWQYLRAEHYKLCWRLSLRGIRHNQK